MPALAGSASACPFCGPPPDSPGVGMFAAEATVIADAVGRRLFFAGDAEAKISVTFKAGRTIRGGGPAEGQTFALVFPAASLAPPAGKTVVTLQRAGRGWIALGAYADAKGEVADYLVKLNALPAGDTAAKVDLLLAHLEHSDDRIAADAHGHFAGVPLTEIEKLRDKLPADRLRRWLLAEKIPSTRKGLYAMMLSLVAAAGDADLLDKALPIAADSAVGSGGILAARVRLGGKPAAVLLPVIRDESRSFACREGAVRAAGWLWETGSVQLRADLRPSMKAALADWVMFPYAVEELIRLKEFSFTDEVKAAWAGFAKTRQNVRLFTRKYAAALPEAQRTELETWLEKNP